MTLRRYTITLAVSFVAAAAATLGVYGLLNAPNAWKRVITRPVVVARNDISEGQLVERANVAVVSFPSGTVPAGAYASVDSVAGRVVLVNIYKGEVIVPRRLARESMARVSK